MAIELHHLNTHDLFRDATKMIDGVMRLKARIAELEKENAELRSKNEGLLYALADAETDIAMLQKWRKCSEELPEDGSDVLATDGEEIWLCYKTTMTDGLPWFQPNGQPHIEGVTHWMPLPKAPEVE